jgi:hypothetical protein
LDYLPPSDPPNPLSPCGTLKLNFANPADMPPESSCALDVAERGEQTLEEIAAVMNMSDERVRQIDLEARERVIEEITRLRESGAWDETEEDETMAAKKKQADKWNGAVAASAAGVAGAVKKGAHVEKLPVRIERDKVEAKAKKMAIVIREREEVLEEKREANAEYRSKLNHFDEQLTELAASVESATEAKNVECIDYLLPTNEIQTVRTDTGEVVETRAATSDELQAKLPLDADDEVSREFPDEVTFEEGTFPAIKPPRGSKVVIPKVAKHHKAKAVQPSDAG